MPARGWWHLPVSAYCGSTVSGAKSQALEVIDAVFYQSTRAYLVGRIIGRGFTAPLAIALRSTEAGIVVDATMLTEDELSILFGFARSYFHVDLERSPTRLRS